MDAQSQELWQGVGLAFGSQMLGLWGRGGSGSWTPSYCPGTLVPDLRGAGRVAGVQVGLQPPQEAF